MVEELKFYTTQEVAKVLSVSVETVRDWLNQGYLKGMLMRGQWRVSDEDINRFIRERYGEGELAVRSGTVKEEA